MQKLLEAIKEVNRKSILHRLARAVLLLKTYIEVVESMVKLVNLRKKATGVRRSFTNVILPNLAAFNWLVQKLNLPKEFKQRLIKTAVQVLIAYLPDKKKDILYRYNYILRRYTQYITKHEWIYKGYLSDLTKEKSIVKVVAWFEKRIRNRVQRYYLTNQFVAISRRGGEKLTLYDVFKTLLDKKIITIDSSSYFSDRQYYLATTPIDWYNAALEAIKLYIEKVINERWLKDKKLRIEFDELNEKSNYDTSETFLTYLAKKYVDKAIMNWKQFYHLSPVIKDTLAIEFMERLFNESLDSALEVLDSNFCSKVVSSYFMQKLELE
jgi:predicted transcriptional regulator